MSLIVVLRESGNSDIISQIVDANKVMIDKDNLTKNL